MSWHYFQSVTFEDTIKPSYFLKSIYICDIYLSIQCCRRYSSSAHINGFIFMVWQSKEGRWNAVGDPGLWKNMRREILHNSKNLLLWFLYYPWFTLTKSTDSRHLQSCNYHYARSALKLNLVNIIIGSLYDKHTDMVSIHIKKLLIGKVKKKVTYIYTVGPVVQYMH